MDKKCIKCDLLKPVTEFYKHPKTADGYLGKCKKCCKAEAADREKENRENPDWIEKEKARHRDKYKRLEYKDQHKPTAEQKKQQLENYFNKFPEKAIAKNLCQRIKPAVKGNQLHHWSYLKEYATDLIELTVQQHATAHRHIIYDPERMMYRRADNGLLLDSRELHETFINSIWKQNR